MIQTVDLMPPIVDGKHIHGSSIGENSILVHGSPYYPYKNNGLDRQKVGPTCMEQGTLVNSIEEARDPLILL